ncbi:MAG: hypothetical protein AAFO03_01730 [Bacteroidota bacterium]
MLEVKRELELLQPPKKVTDLFFVDGIPNIEIYNGSNSNTV